MINEPEVTNKAIIDEIILALKKKKPGITFIYSTKEVPEDETETYISHINVSFKLPSAEEKAEEGVSELEEIVILLENNFLGWTIPASDDWQKIPLDEDTIEINIPLTIDRSWFETIEHSSNQVINKEVIDELAETIEPKDFRNIDMKKSITKEKIEKPRATVTKITTPEERDAFIEKLSSELVNILDEGDKQFIDGLDSDNKPKYVIPRYTKILNFLKTGSTDPEREIRKKILSDNPLQLSSQKFMEFKDTVIDVTNVHTFTYDEKHKEALLVLACKAKMRIPCTLEEYQHQIVTFLVVLKVLNKKWGTKLTAKQFLITKKMIIKFDSIAGIKYNAHQNCAIVFLKGNTSIKHLMTEAKFRELQTMIQRGGKRV